MRLIPKTTRRLLETREMKCYLCGKELANPHLIFSLYKVKECRSGKISFVKNNEICTMETYTVDHVLPRSKGGTNDITNLEICCYKCNQEKGNR